MNDFIYPSSFETLFILLALKKSEIWNSATGQKARE